MGQRSGGVGSARSVDGSTGMSGRRRQVQPADRGLGATPAGDGAEDELLVQLAGAATDVTTDEVRVDPLHVDRRQHVPRKDQLGEPRCQRLDPPFDTTGELLPLPIVPPTRDAVVAGIDRISCGTWRVGPRRFRARR